MSIEITGLFTDILQFLEMPDAFKSLYIWKSFLDTEIIDQVCFDIYSIWELIKKLSAGRSSKHRDKDDFWILYELQGSTGFLQGWIGQTF